MDTFFKDIKDLLLKAPDGQLDASQKPLIEKWDDFNPSSLSILEVLDNCIWGSLASGFTVNLLQELYDKRLKIENTTHEENVKFAHWRKYK